MNETEHNRVAGGDSGRTEELMQYEPWVRLIARLECDQRFRGKFSQSDVVQQTMMEAWRNWNEFEAEGDPARARMAWLTWCGTANQIKASMAISAVNDTADALSNTANTKQIYTKT